MTADLSAVAVKLSANLLHNITRCPDLDKIFIIIIDWASSLGETEADKVNQAELG